MTTNPTFLTAPRAAALAIALGTLPLMAACGSSTPSSSPTTSTSVSTSESAAAPAPASSEPMASPSASEASPSSSAAAASQTFGSGCSAIPSTGKGSFDGMSTAAVATAASNNPQLSTLVTAVKKAGLVDTLNNTPDITVFAPNNDAFSALKKSTLTKVLADRSQLTKILTTHVVKGQISPDQLAGPHKTLSGSTITVTGSGENFTVNGNAKVVCGNITTANATVYIINRVLMPN